MSESGSSILSDVNAGTAGHTKEWGGPAQYMPAMLGNGSKQISPTRRRGELHTVPDGVSLPLYGTTTTPPLRHSSRPGVLPGNSTGRYSARPSVASSNVVPETFSFYQPSGQDRKMLRVAEAVGFAEDEKKRAFDKMLVLEDKLEAERTRANDLQLQLDTREIKLAKGEETIRRLRSEGDQTRNDLSQSVIAQHRVRALEEELKRAHASIDDAKRQHQAHEDATVRHAVLEQELRNTRELLATSQTALSDAATRQASKYDEAQLRWEVMDVRNTKRIAELEDEVSRLQAALIQHDNVHDRATNLEDRMHSALAAERVIQQQARYMETQLSAAAQRVEDLEGQARAKDSSIATLTEKLAEAEEAKRRQDLQMERLQARVDDLERQASAVPLPAFVPPSPRHVVQMPQTIVVHQSPQRVLLPAHHVVADPQSLYRQLQVQPQLPVQVQQPMQINQYETPPTDPPPFQPTPHPPSMAAIFTPARR